MKYYYIPSNNCLPKYGMMYRCDHILYNSCTLYLAYNKGLAVIQQRYDPNTKHTWWTDIDKIYVDDIYLNNKFNNFFELYAKEPNEKGIYPTVTLRQVMWKLRMKPIKREKWETYFDKIPL